MGAVGQVVPVRRDTLHVLPSGRRFAEPGTLFRSKAFERLLSGAREKFDLVILDAPSVHHFAETRFLTSKVDGVILVVQAGGTRRRTAISAKKQIEDAGAGFLLWS